MSFDGACFLEVDFYVFYIAANKGLVGEIYVEPFHASASYSYVDKEGFCNFSLFSVLRAFPYLGCI